MGVEIKLPSYLVPGNGPKCPIIVNCKTIGQCLSEVVRLCPTLEDKIFEKKGCLRTYFTFYINDKSVYQNDLETVVNNGDKITVAFLIAGG